MPVARPQGNHCYAGGRRILVRGFDTAHSQYGDIEGEDRFCIDDSRVNHDSQHPLRRGDIVLLNGQFEGDEETSLCAPGRVIAIGQTTSRTHVRVWCLIDGDQITPAHGNDSLFIARTLLLPADRNLVADLALEGRPAIASEGARLMALFGLGAKV